MVMQEFRFDPSQILRPAYPSPLNRLDPVSFGPSLNITRGQALARQNSSGKMYPLNKAATDGTQLFAGFAQYSCSTDTNGVVYLTFGGTAPGIGFYSPPSSYSDIYTGGIFDPNDLQTAPLTGTATAEVDTVTVAGTVVTGDVYTINSSVAGEAAEFTVGATATATAAASGLIADWNGNPNLAAIATATSSAGVVTLTGVNAGQALGITVGKNSTAGTIAYAQTTAPVAATQAEVDTFTPGGTITTGDVYTLTITSGGLQTTPISFTVGATATAGAVSAGLIAAWNANATAAAYAMATGTNTVVLTSALPGNIMNIAGTAVGVGTVSKSVTAPAFGRNIADILPGAPGSRILQASGFWEIP